MIYQAFTNLTSNALKFAPPGGRVTIRTLIAGSRVRVELHDTIYSTISDYRPGR